jgi:hypothetical protein
MTSTNFLKTTRENKRVVKLAGRQIGNWATGKFWTLRDRERGDRGLKYVKKYFGFHSQNQKDNQQDYNSFYIQAQIDTWNLIRERERQQAALKIISGWPEDNNCGYKKAPKFRGKTFVDRLGRKVEITQIYEIKNDSNLDDVIRRVGKIWNDIKYVGIVYKM